MKTVSNYLSLVKFSHTIFALPFALFAFVFLVSCHRVPFEWLLLVKILICMVSARNAAMGFNRWADRDIDARNARTASRDIPAGRISPRAALIFVVCNSVIFVAAAAWINRLAFILSPVALCVLLGYSLAKRFTASAHIILGTALAIAPVGVSVAVLGSFSAFSLMLAALVLTWTAGFDILYSMQDFDFDSAEHLHSIPVRFGLRGAAALSILLHLLTIATAVWIGTRFFSGAFYWIGFGAFVAVMLLQHILYPPSRADRVGATFGLVNGAASILFCAFGITAVMTGQICA